MFYEAPRETSMETGAVLINSFEIHLGYIGSISDPLVTNTSCIKSTLSSKSKVFMSSTNASCLASRQQQTNRKIFYNNVFWDCFWQTVTQNIYFWSKDKHFWTINSASGPLVDWNILHLKLNWSIKWFLYKGKDWYECGIQTWYLSLAALV